MDALASSSFSIISAESCFARKYRSYAVGRKFAMSASKSPRVTFKFNIRCCLANEDQVNPEATDVKAHVVDQPNTVRVRFQLQKQCQFGQQFLLIGEDPTFGSWDPGKAIPLEWSDGHAWTVDLDLPSGILIQYKFILQGTACDIEWQPGPDRHLLTWKTNNLIIVSEDWENFELQKIVEEAQFSEIEKKREENEENLVNLSNDDNVLSNTVATDKDQAITKHKVVLTGDKMPVLVPGLPYVSSQVSNGKPCVEEIPSDINVVATVNDADSHNTLEVTRSSKIENQVVNIEDIKISQEVIETQMDGIDGHILGASDRAEASDRFNAPEICSNDELVFNGVQRLSGPGEADNLNLPQVLDGTRTKEKILAGNADKEHNMSEELNFQPVVAVLETDMQWAQKMVSNFFVNMGFRKNQAT